MARSAAPSATRPKSLRLTRSLVVVAALVAAVLVLGPATVAVAGQASSGQLLFYPCTSCHPVKAGKALPNGFKGHEVVLQGHDKLGAGDAACLVCHDDPSRNPGMLKTVDGSLIDIKGDVALVCFRCHSAKYEQWKAGTHGKNRPKCTDSGCHDPHTPGSVYAGALLPFVGGGFQVTVMPERAPFMSLAQPGPPPGVKTPMWFAIVAVVGLVAVGGQVVRLARGRHQR